MPRFTYEAKDQTDRLVEGAIEASSRERAIDRLNRRYQVLLSLHEERREFQLPAWMIRVSGESVALFYRRFVTLLSVGIPAHRAIHYLTQDEDDPRMHAVLVKMYQRLEAGASIARAMSEHPGAFTPLMTAMVRAGEESGQLTRAFDRLAEFTEKAVRLRKRVVSALAYPAFQMVMAIVLIGGFVMFAVPRMQAIFDLLGGQMPFLTRLLIRFVDGVRNPLTWIGLTLAVVGLAAGLLVLRRNPRFQDALDRKILELPGAGPLLRKMAVSRMLHAFAMVLQAGIPLGSQLSMVGEVAGNRYMMRRFGRVRDEMMRGKAIFQAFEESGIFQPAVIQMIRVGEESGTLDVLCQRVASFQDDEVEMTLNEVASLVEPLVLGVTGMVVALVALAVGLPTIELIQRI